MHSYCCIKMEAVVQENKTPVLNTSLTDSYFITYHHFLGVPIQEVPKPVLIHFCPFCGKKLTR